MKSEWLREYFDWELNPMNGWKGNEEVGMLIGIEEGLVKMFNISSGEEDLLFGKSLDCKDWALRASILLEVWFCFTLISSS